MDTELLAKTLKIFRIVAAEFVNIPDDDEVTFGETTYGVNTYIDLFSDQISYKKFGSMYPKALAYLTAHKLKMMDLGTNSSSSGGSIGSVADQLRLSSASEGETSVSFNNNAISSSDSDSEYTLTVYGVEFLTLKRLAVVPIVSAGEPVMEVGGRYVP